MHLVSARSGYWENGTIPDYLNLLWQQAQLLISGWRGFRRLTISAETEAMIEDLNKTIDELSRGVTQEIEETPGIVRWRWDLRKGSKRRHE
jgi:hypothetical protein